MPRILLVKTSSMGDLVHTMPMVTDIVRHHPDAQIDWVVEESFADIPRLHPRVERIIPVAVRRWRKTPFARAVWRELATLRQALRAESYDYIIDAQGLIKSAVIARLARGPIMGRDRRSVREPLATLLYRRAVAVPKGHHAVWRNRMLGAGVFDYRFDPDQVDYGMRPSRVLPLRLPQSYVVCVHGCSDPKRWWPNEHWIELANLLLAAGLTPLLPWGNAAEEANAQAIAAGCRDAIVLPRLRLQEHAAILFEAHGVIGVDTGLMHLSMGLARPTVAIFYYTDPKLSGAMGVATPWGANVGHIGVRATVAQVVSAARGIGIAI